MALVVKNPTANAENLGDMASIPEQELPLEEGIFLPNILAWRIPWTEEPGWLEPLGLQRVGHD